MHICAGVNSSVQKPLPEIPDRTALDFTVPQLWHGAVFSASTPPSHGTWVDPWIGFDTADGVLSAPWARRSSRTIIRGETIRFAPGE